MGGRTLWCPETFGLRIVRNGLAGVSGAILFFLVTNFSVWLFADEAFYARTLGGLLECYAAAIPFHRNDFLSLLVYVPIFTYCLQPVETSTAVESVSASALR